MSKTILAAIVTDDVDVLRHFITKENCGAVTVEKFYPPFPLWVALLHRSFACIAYLIDIGVDVNLEVHRFGRPSLNPSKPLQMAIQENLPLDLMKRFLEAGANPNSIPPGTRSALSLACQSPFKRQYIELLIDFGAKLPLDIDNQSDIQFICELINKRTAALEITYVICSLRHTKIDKHVFFMLAMHSFSRRIK